MKLEVLATPQQGLTKDDLLDAVVSAVGDVTRASARQYVGGLVSVVVHTENLLDASEVAAFTRQVSRSCLSAPEVTVR